MAKELILRKEKVEPSTGLKPMFIDAELHSQLKSLKEETGISMTALVSKFIRYGLENAVIKEEDDE